MRALLVLAAALCLGAIGRAQARWYVDDSATGANTGTSWSDAFTDLQAALAAAAGGDAAIWVAEGTYVPSSTGDRTASFRPSVGIAIYGGFAGTESSFDERAGLFDRTVLSGDLAGDDGPGFANRADNSEHIVVPSELTYGTLDGFTIRGGHATTSLGGGAWYSPDVLSQFFVRRCTFQDNGAQGRGGAVYIGNGPLHSFADCLFIGNRAPEGGAAYSKPMSYQPIYLDRCRFLANVATGVGGGALAGEYQAFCCLFDGNSADGTSRGGGAILGSGTLWWSTLSGNHALGGPLVGGIRGGAYPKASILWGNFDDRGPVLGAQLESPFDWTYAQDSCVQGWTPAIGGVRMISGDPEFVDPLGPDGVAGNLDDDFDLGPLSPCVDLLPFDPYAYVDIEERPRNVETRGCAAGVFDAGAYERQVPGSSPRFCPATASSIGQPAQIDALCLLELDGGPVDVDVSLVPAGFGMLLLGDSRTQVRYGNGFLCVGGAVRASPARAAQGNVLHFDFDPAAAARGVIVAGSTWNLQAVYRDRGPGGAGFNASDALAITVLP